MAGAPGQLPWEAGVPPSAPATPTAAAQQAQQALGFWTSLLKICLARGGGRRGRHTLLNHLHPLLLLALLPVAAGAVGSWGM